MTDLPSGWECVRLDEIAETSLGKMLDRGRSTGEHLVPYLRNVNVQWGRIDLDDILTMEIHPDERERYRLEPGDLLVCEGGEIGRCAIWQGEPKYVAFQKALHRVRLLCNVEPKFIRYLFEYMNYTGAFLPYATGSTIKHLPQQQLRQLRLALPPIAEQRRIVAALEDHLSRLDTANSALSTSTIRLKTWFSTLITVASVDARQGSLPPGWKWSTLAEVAMWGSGGTPAAKNPQYYDGGIPWAVIGDLNDGVVKTTASTITEHGLENSAARLVPAGTLLMAMYGSIGKLGIAGVPMAMNQAIAYAQVDSGILDSKFLFWYLRSQRGEFRGAGKGATQKNISQTVLKPWRIPVPPLVEQRRIVATLENADQGTQRLKAAIDDATRRASNLRRSLLTGAFAGRLVAQDPSDEPASELLVRIRAEREAQPSRRRTPRGSGRTSGGASRTSDPASTQEESAL